MPEQLGCVISTFLIFVFLLVFLILIVYAFSRNKYMQNSYCSLNDDYYYDTYEDSEDVDSTEDSDEYY